MSERLFVIPAKHPEQASLPAHRRQEEVARQHGAVWADDRSVMIAPETLPEQKKQLLKRLYGSSEAERSYTSAMERLRDFDRDEFGPVSVDRKMIAAAALHMVGAVDRAGKTPAKGGDRSGDRVGAAGPQKATPGEASSAGDVTPLAERTYYYTSADPRSNYSLANLARTAERAGVELHVDRSRKENGDPGERFGLRYSLGAAHDDLKFFRTPEAQEEWRASFERRRQTRALIGRVAAQMVAEQDEKLLPLTLPKPPEEGDHNYHPRQTSFERAANAIRSIKTPKLERLVGLNRQLMQSLRKREDALAADGRRLSIEEKREYAKLQRGLTFGEYVLEERRHRREAGQTRSDVIKAANRGAAGGQSQKEEVR